MFTLESITSQVSKLGKKIHFGAETCGVQICDDRTWLRGTYTVKIGFAYVLSADEACQRGAGPFLSGSKARAEACGLGVCRKPPGSFIFITKKPIQRRERFGLLVIWPLIWLNQFTQTLPHRLPRLVLSSYVSPLDRLQVTAALIGATALIGGVDDDGAPSARSRGTSPCIW